MESSKFLNFLNDVVLPWLLQHGIKILIILVIAYVLGIIFRRIIVRTVKIAVTRDEFSSENDEVKREETLIRIFSGIVKIVLWLMAAMMILKELGVEIAPILAGAGIAGIAIGFGAQYIIKDIITGLFIILENQYRIGDVVSFGTISGAVEDISLRMTTLRSVDGIVHHMPHGEVRAVSNLTKGFSRVNINVGVDYSSNIDKVIAIVDKTGKLMAEDPQWKDKIISPIKFIRVDEFEDSAISVKIMGDTVPHAQWETAGEFRKRLKAAFDAEGIVIPLPQRVNHSA